MRWAFGCLKQQVKINWFGFDFCSCNSWIRVDCWQGVEVFIMELAIKEDQLEVLKTDVWTKLPQLNVGELEQVCTALDLTIAPASQGRKSAVYSLVALHLMSNNVETMEIDLALEI